MFLHLPAILSTGGLVLYSFWRVSVQLSLSGADLSLGVICERWPEIPLPSTHMAATEAGGMYPTGMQTCQLCDI